MTIKLKNGELFIKGEMSDVFEVKIRSIEDNFFIKIELMPVNETMINGVESEFYLIDTLNETIPDVLKEDGYKIIDKNDIKWIQKSEF